MGYEETHIDVNGVDTAVFSAGEGDPVVLFHGGGTATGFDCMLPIAKTHRLIVAHHPGFGASGDPACTTVTDLVRHKLDLLDALDIDTFSLIGHSMGGWTAATLASFDTSRITKLILVAPYSMKSAANPSISILSLPPEDLLSYLTADMSIFGPADGPPPPPEFFAERERETNSFAAIVRDSTYDESLAPWLHRIDVPTLILWGEADRVIPFGQAAEWKALLPNASVTSFAGAGHLLFDEKPEAVAAVIDFVNS